MAAEYTAQTIGQVATDLRVYGTADETFFKREYITTPAPATPACPACHRGFTMETPQGARCIGDRSHGVGACGWVSWSDFNKQRSRWR